MYKSAQMLIEKYRGIEQIKEMYTYETTPPGWNNINTIILTQISKYFKKKSKLNENYANMAKK